MKTISLLYGQPADVIREAIETQLVTRGGDVVYFREYIEAWGRVDCCLMEAQSTDSAREIAASVGADCVDLVRIDSLRAGTRFRAFDGRTYVFTHNHRGCCWTEEGECFAGCADVEVLNG